MNVAQLVFITLWTALSIVSLRSIIKSNKAKEDYVTIYALILFVNFLAACIGAVYGLIVGAIYVHSLPFWGYKVF